MSTKAQLAVALARGISPAQWARKNGVTKMTAYRWSKEPEVPKAVEEFRRRTLDLAIGWFTTLSTRAMDGNATPIVKREWAELPEEAMLGNMRWGWRATMPHRPFADGEPGGPETLVSAESMRMRAEESPNRSGSIVTRSFSHYCIRPRGRFLFVELELVERRLFTRVQMLENAVGVPNSAK